MLVGVEVVGVSWALEHERLLHLFEAAAADCTRRAARHVETTGVRAAG